MKGLTRISLSNIDPRKRSADPPVAEHLQQRLESIWLTIAGNPGMHSRPILFQSGRLVVICNDPLWTNDLRMQQRSLQRKLKQYAIEISSLSIKTRHQRAQPQRNEEPPLRHIAPQQAHHLLNTAHKISHPGMRSALLRLAKKHLNKPNREDEKDV